MRARIRRDERGQVFIVVALAMVVLVGMAALAVDVANWYQARHRAQVAADAAALAAANCMVWQSQTRAASDPVCSSTTDAATVATNFAATNGISIPTSNVSFSSKFVTVTTTDPTPGFFSGLFGIHHTSPTAVAVAKWGTNTSSDCNTSQATAGNCYFIFAADTNCAGNNNTVTISHNGTGTFTGGIWSNGNINSSNTGNETWPIINYGPPGPPNCKMSRHGDHNDTFPTGYPKQASAIIPNWPRDWTTTITACTPVATCVPSYCTDIAANYTSLTPVSGHVYCAYGTGTQGNPSTWNGTITITSGNTQGVLQATYIAGTVNITLQSNTNQAAQLTTPLGNLWIYANNGATVTSQGNATMNGDIFVPNGTANISTGGGDSLTTFIEAQDVVLNVSGNVAGDGPAAGPNGAPIPGQDLLIQ
jgi:Flp pilus assembly protein TadG